MALLDMGEWHEACEIAEEYDAPVKKKAEEWPTPQEAKKKETEESVAQIAHRFQKKLSVLEKENKRLKGDLEKVTEEKKELRGECLDLHWVKLECEGFQRCAEEYKVRIQHANELDLHREKEIKVLERRNKDLEKENSKLIKQRKFLESEQRSLDERLFTATLKVKDYDSLSETLVKTRIELSERKDLEDSHSNLEEKYLDLRHKSVEMIDLLDEELAEAKEKCQEFDEWRGAALKFEYLFKEIKRVGLQQSEWILDSAEDIEIPETSIHIREKFVPTAETDNIDHVDVETDREIIQELSREAEEFSRALEESSMMENPQIRRDSAITIQRFYRGYISRGIRYIPGCRDLESGYIQEAGVVNFAREHGAFPYKNTDLPQLRGSMTGIRFSNTGTSRFSIRWICPRTGYKGPVTTVRPWQDKGIKTLASHVFSVREYKNMVGAKEEKFIRIPLFHQGDRQAVIFDLQTGITYPRKYFDYRLTSSDIRSTNVLSQIPPRNLSLHDQRFDSGMEKYWFSALKIQRYWRMRDITDENIHQLNRHDQPLTQPLWKTLTSIDYTPNRIKSMWRPAALMKPDYGFPAHLFEDTGTEFTRSRGIPRPLAWAQLPK